MLYVFMGIVAALALCLYAIFCAEIRKLRDKITVIAGHLWYAEPIRKTGGPQAWPIRREREIYMGFFDFFAGNGHQ